MTWSINHYLVEVAVQLSKDWDSSLCSDFFALVSLCNISFLFHYLLSEKEAIRAGSVCWALRRNPRDTATSELHSSVSLGQAGGFERRNKSDRSASLTWAVWWPRQGVRAQPVSQRGENNAPEPGGGKSDSLPVRVGPKAIASTAKRLNAEKPPTCPSLIPAVWATGSLTGVKNQKSGLEDSKSQGTHLTNLSWKPGTHVLRG